MATVYRNKSGSWVCQIRRLGRPGLSKTFTTRVEARDWAYKQEALLLESSSDDRSKAEVSILFSELISRFREEELGKYRSKRTAISILKKLDSCLGRYHSSEVSALKIVEFRDLRLREGVSSSSVHRDLSLLSKIIRIASTEWGVNIPAAYGPKLLRPRLESKRIQRPAPEDLEKLLRMCNARHHAEMGLLIRLGLATAMRLGELLAICIEQIDFYRRTIYLPVTKNGEARHVPLSNGAIEIIGLLIEGRDSGKLFARWPSADACKSEFRRIRAKAGLHSLRFHDLRHEATTRFFEMGLNPIQVSSITGHKSLQMLSRYTHLDPSDLATLLDTPKSLGNSDKSLSRSSVGNGKNFGN